jgi:Ca2+-binding RTX toxin-like protein
MKTTLLLALCALLILPSAASAATADADVERRGGAPFGPVTFKAGKGELNRVTVTSADGRLRFRDSANRVRARGDCEQVDRHTAICPFTEDIAQIRLGNRDDRATVENLVEVLGGPGNDLLRGSQGADRLSGERGNDELHGAPANDVLTGGPGRDRLFGGSGDDDLIDGETDAQAAADLFRGGSSRDTRFGADRGDMLDYSNRKRALDIDLSRGRANFGREGDVVRGLESVAGGAGDDKLSGDGDDNWILAGGGDDRVRGRGGDDIPRGGNGNDRVSGDDGNDTVWGDRQADSLFGGDGDDLVIGRDSSAETVACGGGNDQASVTRLDRVDECERASSSQLIVSVQPEIEGDTATFQVACLSERGCSGTISISTPSGAESYGSGEFSGLAHGADAFTPVEVDLTAAGSAALQQGEVVLVTFPGSTGGYRAFIQDR